MDALITPEELKKLKESTPQCGDHAFAVDTSATGVLAMSGNGLSNLVIVNRDGLIAFRGSFPDSYEGLKALVEKAVVS